MTRRRLVVSRRLPREIEARAVATYDTQLNPDDRAYTGLEFVDEALAFGADALLVSLTERFGQQELSRLAGKVGIISTFSVGYEHIDVEAARDLSIAVGNAPNGVTVATAEIAMLLILGAARRAPEGERLLREREWTGWRPMLLLGQRLDRKRLGILGLGQIGQALAKRARAFDMEIHYHNRRRLPADQEHGAVYHDSFESLCRVSDVLSINAPSTPETRHIVNDHTIEMLPAGAIVVNTARGTLVDDDALIAALRSGRVSYAGLDVFEGEPNIHPGYYDLANAFLLPHMGTSAIEARLEMGHEALDNIDAYFAGRPLPHAVT